MKTDFSALSYLSQVRRLRKLAEEALEKYQLGRCRLEFINHGENTTFKVTTSHGKKYLLRIHRKGYHTPQAIGEEIRWLKRLSKTSIPVQKPVPARDGKLLVAIKSSFVGEVRYCDVFEWVEGKIRTRGLTHKDFYLVGELTARLQQSTSGVKTHRDYWSAEGLIGDIGKFGRMKDLEPLLKKDYADFTKARKMVLRKLKAYEKKYPHKMGLIHSDLHFGNVLWQKGEVKPIDFDDCGYGFHIYDLATTWSGGEVHLQRAGHKKKEVESFKQALFEGYRSVSEMTSEDEEIFFYLLHARFMGMMMWLRERQDNPRLVAYRQGYFKKSLKRFRRELL